MVRGFVPLAGLIINTAVIIVATLFIYGEDLLLIFSKALVFSPGNIGNYIWLSHFCLLLLSTEKDRFYVSLLALKKAVQNAESPSMYIRLCCKLWDGLY